MPPFHLFKCHNCLLQWCLCISKFAWGFGLSHIVTECQVSVTFNRYWVSSLALSFMLIVQYLLSPYSWSPSEMMRSHPAHLPFWKSSILSERQLACPKLQSSGFINNTKLETFCLFWLLLLVTGEGFPSFLQKLWSLSWSLQFHGMLYFYFQCRLEVIVHSVKEQETRQWKLYFNVEWI